VPAVIQIDGGIAVAQALLKREIGCIREKHLDTAVAHGTLAMGYLRAGRDVDATNEFRAAAGLDNALDRPATALLRSAMAEFCRIRTG
jgi:hypothetical protein